MLSPDEDFSQTGVQSGIKYAESFKKYKEMLTGDVNSSTFKRVFSEFNAHLFGKVPTLRNDLIADDGDYDSEVEQFMNELLTDSPVNAVTDAEANKTPPPSSLPISPLRSNHHVSISVTSHVSHTVAASSQVSNIVSSSIALSPEPEVGEIYPPNPEATQPPVRPTARKKSAKLSKPTATDSDADANTAPNPRKKSNWQAKPAARSGEHSTRALRSRT